MGIPSSPLKCSAEFQLPTSQSQSSLSLQSYVRQEEGEYGVPSADQHTAAAASQGTGPLTC